MFYFSFFEFSISFSSILSTDSTNTYLALIMCQTLGQVFGKQSQIIGSLATKDLTVKQDYNAGC